jgi:hypothetical protein
MNIKHIMLTIVLVATAALGQINSVLTTTTTAAMTQTQTTVTVSSATGIVAPSTSAAGSALYIVDIGNPTGELVNVTAVSGTTISINRASSRAKPHVSGAMVLVATAPNWFNTTDPYGSCTTATVYASPWVNTLTGRQWLCSSKTLSWVPGWNNSYNKQVITATATASVAGATAISAPLVHISGTNAITSFTMGTGWNGDGFCVVPDGAFTGTATNNIGKAFTAVASRTLCFTWDAVNSSFTPSY